MSHYNISKDEQKQLREIAKAKLLRLKQRYTDMVDTQTIDNFKKKFKICEDIYKIFWCEHQKAIGNDTDKGLKIDMRQVPNALIFAGYTFERNLLNNLFKASPTEDGKTVKILYEAITLKTNKKAEKEILKRKEELFGYMDTFLNIIETFDSNVA